MSRGNSVHLYPRAPLPWSDTTGRSSQLEHQLESVVDGAQLVVCQMVDPFSERTHIDGANHLAKDLR
jgi:hypothetical protein